MAKVMAEPVAGLELIRDLPKEMQGSFLRQALKAIKTTDDAASYAVAVLNWTEPEVRERNVDELMDMLSRFGDFTATSALLDSLPGTSGERKADARLELVKQSLAGPDLLRRIAWALAAASPEAQGEVASGIVTARAAQDHDAAGTWLNQHQSAPWYDAAALTFARQIQQKDPATAFDWSLTISNEPTRHDALGEVMSHWQETDAAAAGAYVEKSTVPDEWKAEMQAR